MPPEGPNQETDRPIEVTSAARDSIVGTMTIETQEHRLDLGLPLWKQIVPHTAGGYRRR